MTKPFVIYHEYPDRSRSSQIIYVGSDKAAAFDALMLFINEDASQSVNGIYHADGSDYMRGQP